MRDKYHRNRASPTAAAAALDGALLPFGLIARGQFRPAAGEIPDDPATVILVGNAGPAMWRAFQASGVSSLDRWTRQTVGNIAADMGATAYYPFEGPPYYPFHRWARRADTVFTSPIGILIHPRYGLWHAYRAALAFAAKLAAADTPEAASPCETCTDKPCLTTCPVDALAPARYDVGRCRAHITSPAGTACLELGCAARRACPVGTEFHYAPAQAAFHMAAFVKGGA